MFFKFTETSPMGQIKEFGSGDWVKQNKAKLIIQACLLFALGLYTGFTFLLAVGALPLIFMPLTSSTSPFSREAFIIQSLWYAPVLFWKARNEKI